MHSRVLIQHKLFTRDLVLPPSSSEEDGYQFLPVDVALATVYTFFA